jgi:hypothetical protein
MSSAVLNILENKFNTSPIAPYILESFGSPTLLCILGSRMFFNLKEAAEHGVNVGTNWSSYSHSALHIEEPPRIEEQ